MPKSGFFARWKFVAGLLIATFAFVQFVFNFGFSEDDRDLRCVLGTLSAALVVNHYKKSEQEFIDRYTKLVWTKKGGYLGVPPRKNPTVDPQRTLAWYNSFANNCGERGYAARFLPSMQALAAGGEGLASIAGRGPHCVGGECRPYLFTMEAVMAGELGYIEEWVLFHLVVGVDHLYLYHSSKNESALAEARGLLRRYTESGVLTLIDISVEGAQSFAHMDVLRFANRTFWHMKLDADEYLVPRGFDNVSHLLRPLAGKGPLQLLVPRYDFGSSGQKERTPGYLIQRFDRSEATPHSFKPAVTTSVWPRLRAQTNANPHIYFRESLVPSCEGLTLLGPLLFCPKNFIVRYVGWIS